MATKDEKRMKKIALATVLAVAVIASASAAWLWGKDDKTPAPETNPTDVAPAEVMEQGAGSPVQLPEAQAELPPGHPLKIQSFDRVMGQADAPVTMIEYASMTCSHCREFHETVLPRIKKDWIESGKVKYVLRDLPWDNLALGISKVTRCAPEEQFYPLVDAYFNAQEQIVTGVDTLGEVKKVARLAGMDGEKVDACIEDGPLHSLILGVKENALQQLQIKGTPTSFINGVRVDGAVTYDDVNKVLEQAYAATQRAAEMKEGAGSPVGQ